MSDHNSTPEPSPAASSPDANLPEQAATRSRKTTRPTPEPILDLTNGPAIIRSMDLVAKLVQQGKLSAHAASSLAAAGRLALQVLREDQAEDIKRLQRLIEERQPQTTGKRR